MGWRLRWGSVLLGVALSGFFDGILLHQVLRWHHLLSAVDDPRLRDIERQVLADGMFHVLMYLLAVLALWMLWKGRDGFSAGGASQRVGALVLLGFGGWNFVDVAGFHWAIGIHRVRMDSPQPLLWDLLWLAAFGAIPFALGLWLHRRSSRAGPGTSPGAGERPDAARNTVAWSVVALTLAGAAYWNSRPPAGAPTLLVYYPAGTAGATIARGLDAADARVKWVNASGTLWALEVPQERGSEALYRHGAWYTSESFSLAACSSWSRLRL
jgi:uncharacterized membrane protein